jgi:hypothetical protein
MDNADRNPVGALQVGPFKGSDHWPVKNEGGREAGKCTKMVPDRGDRFLFTFLSSRFLSFNAFPFPVSCKAQLIGDLYKNRRGALNAILLHIIRQYYWHGAPMHPAPQLIADRTRKKLLAHLVWSALPIGGGEHQCANILVY